MESGVIKVFKKTKFIIFALTVMLLVGVNSNMALASQPSNSYSSINDEGVKAAFDAFFTDWQMFLAFLSGLTVLTCILAFIILMVKLANAGSNAYERSEVMKQIVAVLVTAALAGSASVVFILLSGAVLI